MTFPVLPDFAWWQWAALYFAAFTVGLAKTGVAGVGIVAVGLFPMMLPPREAVGSVLLLLIAADILAVVTYKRDAEWRYLVKLFPWAAAGVVLGFLLMGRVNDAVLTRIIGAVLLVLAAIQLYQKARPTDKEAADLAPGSPLLSAGAGTVAGFTTMVANAAGPVMILYLLAMRLPKVAFVGTAAWFFFLINLFKVPFSIAVGGIKLSGLVLALALYPGALVGGLVGKALLPKIDQKVFEWLALLFTVAAGVKLVL
jgi:uncharacterized protein